MTPEELHDHNRAWAIDDISYKAVCKVEAVCAFRTWINQFLAEAYDKGYENAKKGMQ